MSYRQLVEIGRVVSIAPGGPCGGKLAAIVDVVDQNRALIDGPTTGVPRQAMPFKRLRLTKYKVKIPHSTSTRVVRKALVAADIEAKYKETAAAKKIVAKEKRKTMNDLDRFKLYKAKSAINNLVRREVARLRSQAKKKVAK